MRLVTINRAVRLLGYGESTQYDKRLEFLRLNDIPWFDVETDGQCGNKVTVVDLDEVEKALARRPASGFLKPLRRKNFLAHTPAAAVADTPSAPPAVVETEDAKSKRVLNEFLEWFAGVEKRLNESKTAQHDNQS